MILDRIAHLEFLRVDGRDKCNLDERVGGNGDGGHGDLRTSEGCRGERSDTLFERPFGVLAEERCLERTDAFLHGAHARLVVDVPLDGVEIHQDGRRCAVRVDLLVECVDARHEAAAAVLAVVVALEAIDAVDECAGLLASVGVLLDEGELRLDGVWRL